MLLAEAGLLGPAERQLVVRDLDVVDPRVPGLEQLGGLARFREVLRPDRRTETVDARVRLRDGLVEVLYDEDRQRRAEDLLGRHARVLRHVSEDRRLHIPALL